MLNKMTCAPVCISKDVVPSLRVSQLFFRSQRKIVRSTHGKPVSQKVCQPYNNDHSGRKQGPHGSCHHRKRGHDPVIRPIHKISHIYSSLKLLEKVFHCVFFPRPSLSYTGRTSLP